MSSARRGFTSGTPRPITLRGAPVLHRRCAEVTVFDDALRSLVADMFASMDEAGGVGLAANQVGVDARVFVIDCPDDREQPTERLVGHVVNPVLTILDDTPSPGGEGCLSLPGPRADLPRAVHAAVTGDDVEGNPVRLEGRGLAARCLQHEIDHLDGLMYLDRLAEPERRRVVEEYDAARLARSPFGSPS